MSQAVHDRLKKSFVALGFAQVVNLIIQIGGIPLFIHFWGSFLYGEWVILSTIPSYFALSDLGFANAAATEMTIRVARGDRAGALKVFQSAWVLVTGVSLLVTLIILAAVRWLPLERWMHVASLGHGQVVTVVSILALQIFFDLQTGLISAGYRADGKFALATILFNIQRLAEFIVAAVALCCGAHLVVLALAVTLTRLFGNTLFMLYMRHLSTWLTLGWQYADLATLKQITLPALSYMGFPIGYALTLQGMVMVVGVVLGPGAVTVFSTSRTLTRFISQTTNSITNPVCVEMSAAFGADNIPLARSLHHRACQAGLWLAVASSIVLFFTGPFVFRLWTHGKVPFDPTLFGLLLLVVVANSFWSVSYAALLSVNRHQKLAAVFVVTTGLSLVLALILTRLIGLHGTALSLLMVDLFMSTYVARRSLIMVQDTMPAFIRFILTPPFLKPPSSPMAEAV